jgi:hypothetical protein
MRLLADENVRPAHVSALDAAGHDVQRVRNLLDTGASDADVLAAARDADRILITYDRKDFADAADHAGVCIADETMPAREVRRSVERIERAYPDLDDVVEFLSDWT